MMQLCYSEQIRQHIRHIYTRTLVFLPVLKTLHKLVNQPRYPLMKELKTIWYKQNTVLFSQEENQICETCSTMERAVEHRVK